MKKSISSAKMAPSPSQPQKTLHHFFQNKNNSVTQISKVSCPGCNLQIPSSRINWHLDYDCKSKKAKKTISHKKKSSKVTTEPKNKLKRAMLSDSEEDSDIDILDKVKNKVADMKAESSNLGNKVNSNTSTTRDLLVDWSSPQTTPIKSNTICKSINTSDEKFKDLECNTPSQSSRQTVYDSEDDFESSTPVFRKAKPTPRKNGSVKKDSTPSQSNTKNQSNKSTPKNREFNFKHTLSSGSSRDSSPDSARGSVKLFSPTPSPSIVSPERSRSPSPENHKENHKDLNNRSPKPVRKLFTPTPSPSKVNSIQIASFANMDNFSNSLVADDKADFKEQQEAWLNLMNSSKNRRSQEKNPNGSRSRSTSRSSSKNNTPAKSLSKNFSPRKLRQALKKTGLLENSNQVVSMLSPKKMSPKKSMSPQKSVNNSLILQSPPKGDISLSQPYTSDGKPDPSFYRDKMGYYLENFLRILDTVMSNTQDVMLFNEDDLSKINTFQGLSLQARKLYVRLFQRKIKWNRIKKIEYKEICDNEDMEMYINELTYAEFLLEESAMKGLEEVLPLLTNEEIHSLCKEMKVSTAGKKEELVLSLMRFSKQQRSIMAAFSKSQQGNSIVLKKARATVGRCCMINKEIRRLFMRVLMLYSLPRYDDDEEGGQQSQLTTLLMVNMGKMIFPEYDILRKYAIFKSRDDLIKFEECGQLENDVREYMEAHKWQEAVELIHIAKTSYEELIKDQQLLAHDASLPTFLRRFTSISILLYILTCGVETYQRLKKYQLAVDLLQELLNQKTHLQDYHGRWYMRLALNLEQHLKKPADAVRTIGLALDDKEVQVGHRLSLSIRAQRMRCSPRYKALYPVIDELSLMNPVEAPKVIIEGRSLPGDIPGQKRQFIRQDSDRHSGEGSVMVCSVEELVLGHYNSIGYSEGVHREGSTFKSLFGIYFWDALYAPVEDVFRSPYQGAPLDLDSPHFYQARKDIIDSRLTEMRQWSEDEALHILEESWIKHQDKVSLVQWDLYRNLDHAKGLVSCIGMRVLSAICERLARNHRFTRSGFPDLVVWEPKNKTCRIVEVKGPNDHLSTKQILWLDFLIANGAFAEVCHVQGE
ncbi:unnamed protein product, partial [Meganyctiphanes norvegica]